MDDVVDAVVRDAAARGDVVVRDGLVALTEQPSLSASDRAVLARVLHRVQQSRREPPSVAELTAELGATVPELLMFAAREGNLVRVESVRYYGAEIIADLVRELRREMQPERAYSPAELRPVVGVSRKYLIPLLEYFDAVGVTERNSGGRIIRTVSSARGV
ncbi:MAG TPA: SelB C-terminal domain-containing protein [Candidatus Elarobacter sp.]|nr:SelB C-terminal domain-containing protein [Candidatus Elarobacter sp.]